VQVIIIVTNAATTTDIPDISDVTDTFRKRQVVASPPELLRSEYVY
jgi:hypothetical protein